MQRMCSICRQVKDKSEFYYKEKAQKFNSYCRDCERLYQKEYKRIYRERKKKIPKRYAIYKGETFLFEGTVKECAEHFNVKEKTVYFWTSPALKKRANENWKVAIRIDDEEE